MQTETITINAQHPLLRERRRITAQARYAVRDALAASPHEVLDVSVDSFKGSVTIDVATDDPANATTLAHEALRDVPGATIPTGAINA